MRLETFFEKFDQIADAPDAVAKMRELVLQLALKGCLIGLNSKCWERVSLGSLGEWGSGGTPLRSEPQYYGGSIPWLVIGDLNDDIVTSASTFITEKGLANSSARILPKGVLLIAMYGSIGKLGITGIECATNQAIAFCKPDSKRTDLRYLFHTMKGIQAALLARGQGLAQKNISQTILKAWEISLPPLAEQKRIVAKVDELMALCDRLEAQQQERETRHATLARASLARFADAATSTNLPLLFHPSYAIPPADLRKSILTLAVQGKLVPQDANDRPAEAPRDASRKAEGKKAKWAGQVEEQEQPFQLPPSWKWLRLGDVSSLKHGYAFSSKFFTSEPAPFVLTTPGNFYEKGGFRDRESKRKYYSGPVDPEFVFKPSDLIIPMTEQAAGLLGSPAFIPDDGRVYIHNQRLGKLTFSDSIAPEFAFWFFNCDFFRTELARTCTGMKVRHTSPDRVLKVPFPLPPLAEQRRIAAKVNELMALVDQLEEQLSTAEKKSAALLEALVHDLLTSPSAFAAQLPDRAAIGCYAIQKLADRNTFGRTAQMKVLYLAEAHVGLALGGQYFRDAAGPLDQWIYTFERQAAEQKWFSVVEKVTNGNHKKITYRNGPNLSAKAGEAEARLPRELRREFDRLLGFLANKPTVEVEIIATLFAAWNDSLIDGHAPSDVEIVREVRENWHPSKRRFKELELKKWLDWMRQHSLVPIGRRPHTRGVQAAVSSH